MNPDHDRPSPGLLLCDRLRDRRLQIAAANGDGDNLVEIRTADGAVLLDACVAAAVSPLLREALRQGCQMAIARFLDSMRLALRSA